MAFAVCIEVVTHLIKAHFSKPDSRALSPGHHVPVQLAVETVYLEATLQLVSKTSSSLSNSQAKALEDLVFDWVLHAEKFVDSRFLELMKARAKVNLKIRDCI